MRARIPNETREKIVSLYQNGKVHREIHEETGVSMASISRICRDAGLDKYHVGGTVARTFTVAPDLPQAEPLEPDSLVITSRVLTMMGTVTGCEYTAGTSMPTVDITLGEWAIQIDTGKLGAFISELQSVKKMIGAA
jgi:hypothetical protein